MRTGLTLPTIPTKLIITPLLSDDEFEQLCAANSDVPLERSKDGEIVVNLLAEFDTSAGNAEITYQLRAWWKTHRRGRVTGSSLGTFLPDGSSLNPDAAYVSEEQLTRLSPEETQRFLPFAPAFVIELRSKTDSVREGRDKMGAWRRNGVELGWLVDPDSRSVFIFEAGKEMRQETGRQIAGSRPVSGFVLDLDEVWSCYSV
jgi:Uma2 family endonuclease